MHRISKLSVSSTPIESNLYSTTYTLGPQFAHWPKQVDHENMLLNYYNNVLSM